MSEIVDFEDPDNQNLETFVLWKQIDDPEKDSKQIWLVEFNYELIPKNINNYDRKVYKEFEQIIRIKEVFKNELKMDRRFL